MHLHTLLHWAHLFLEVSAKCWIISPVNVVERVCCCFIDLMTQSTVVLFLSDDVNGMSSLRHIRILEFFEISHCAYSLVENRGTMHGEICLRYFLLVPRSKDVFRSEYFKLLSILLVSRPLFWSESRHLWRSQVCSPSFCNVVIVVLRFQLEIGIGICSLMASTTTFSTTKECTIIIVCIVRHVNYRLLIEATNCTDCLIALWQRVSSFSQEASNSRLLELFLTCPFRIRTSNWSRLSRAWFDFVFNATNGPLIFGPLIALDYS